MQTGGADRAPTVIRVVAFVVSVLGVLLVSARVVWGSSPSEDSLAISVMGGAVAMAPFVLACALNEFLRERRSQP